MLFSIIVPIYNVEAFLVKCVESVLSQTYKDFELILVDDGSPDNCHQICDNYEKKDDRIVVFHKENGGQSSARNAGIDAAKGEYLIFIDSDDYWCDNKLLEGLNERINLFGEDMILYGCKIVHSDGSVEVTRSCYNLDVLNRHNKKETLESLSSQNNLPGAAWIYTIRRSVIEDNHIRFTEGVSAEDFEWVVNSLILSKSIGTIEGVQYAYVKHEGSVTTKAKYSHILGSMNAIERYYKLGQRCPALDRFLARIYLLAVMSYNQLTNEDKKKSDPLLHGYMYILKDARQDKYYWFVKIFGLRLSSFAIRKAYDFIR